MSLLPSYMMQYQFADPWEVRRLRSNAWDNFGLGVTPQEIRELVSFPLLPHHMNKRLAPDVVPPTIGKDGFQVSVDVQQFRPNEVTVKTVDNTVIVEGKHEERQDHHGYIERHFVRKYTLPKDYDTRDVVSTLSSDGFLTIKAPKPTQMQHGNERIVHVHHTGPAHLHVKDHTGAGGPDKK